MPYIPKKDRAKLDAAIDALADRIVDEAKEYDYDGAFAGLLNYSCTCLALRVIRKRFGKMRYWLIAMVTGTFKNVGDEFYRRVGVPYEDKQIEKSGDTDLYREYAKEIGDME